MWPKAGLAAAQSPPFHIGRWRFDQENVKGPSLKIDSSEAPHSPCFQPDVSVVSVKKIYAEGCFNLSVLGIAYPGPLIVASDFWQRALADRGLFIFRHRRRLSLIGPAKPAGGHL